MTATMIVADTDGLLSSIALAALGRLTAAEHERVLARLATSHPTLVLDAVRAVETPWHGKVE